MYPKIAPIAGAEFAGPLPAEIQSYIVFSAGVNTAAKDAAAATSFINFLKSPAAIPVLQQAGIEPG